MIISLIKQDPIRWHALDVLAQSNLHSAWIGAGFVRNLVWDHFHGQKSDCRTTDLDVLWFDIDNTLPEIDMELEEHLRTLDPSFNWSVKNQARMHIRNHDTPYIDVIDAMRHWPETATAIATQRQMNSCHLIAPFGYDDISGMVLRPTSRLPHKLTAFRDRIESKQWQTRWPKLTITPP